MTKRIAGSEDENRLLCIMILSGSVHIPPEEYENAATVIDTFFNSSGLV